MRSGSPGQGRGRAAVLSGALLLGLAGGAAVAQEGASAPPERRYEVLFDARILPTERAARVTIRLGEGASLVRRILLRVDPERHVDWSGDGEISIEGDEVSWAPPRGGGRLEYFFRIDHLRTSSGYDARCAESWALFRGGDMFPPARVRAVVGAHSRSRLRLRVPDGWSVAVPYARRGSFFEVENPNRRFDRPTGWMAAGRLGVVRERIAGVRVAVAGPVGQGVRRHDMLALLRWTLPALRDAIGELPDRLLVVGAGDPMWRGGLSGPRSVFVHADRPLISVDMSSPLLHEIVHAAMSVRSGKGGDWIVEGLAELYSLEMLVRSRTMSRRRFDKVLRRLADKGRGVVRLDVAESSGPVTARAATLLHDLDGAIAKATDGAAGLDEVLARLARRREPVTPELLRNVASEVAGRDLDGFLRSRAGAPLTRRPSSARGTQATR